MKGTIYIFIHYIFITKEIYILISIVTLRKESFRIMIRPLSHHLRVKLRSYIVPHFK